MVGSESVARLYARPSGREGREGSSEDAPKTAMSWVRSVGTPSALSEVHTATAPASSSSCRTWIPASSAAFESACLCVSLNHEGAAMTVPMTFLPRKSSADWRREPRKMVVTSDTVRMRSTSTGSERGAATWEVAGMLVAVAGMGDGAGWRTLTLYAGVSDNEGY